MSEDAKRAAAVRERYLREDPPPEPSKPPPPPDEDWHGHAAEVRARAAADIGESAELVEGLTELMRAKSEPKREPRKVEMPAPRSEVPKVSECIEDKIRFAWRKGAQGDALFSIVRSVDREKRSDAQLRELVARVTCEAVTA